MKTKNDFKDLTKAQKEMYNCFVDAYGGRLLTKLKVFISETGHLHFEIETEQGISNETAALIFDNFIKKYPKCGVTYNLPKEDDALTKELINKSEAVFLLEGGFKLKKL